MAAYGEKVTTADRSCVKVAVDGSAYVLCVLSARAVEQQPLDVVFEFGETITFGLSGKSNVYLTGNYLPQEAEELSDPTDDELVQMNLEGLQHLADGAMVEEGRGEEPGMSPYEGENVASAEENEVADMSEELGANTDEENNNLRLEEVEQVETGAKRKAKCRSAEQTGKKLKDNAAAAVPTHSVKMPPQNPSAPAGTKAAATEQKARSSAPVRFASVANAKEAGAAQPQQVQQKKSKSQKRAEKRARKKAEKAAERAADTGGVVGNDEGEQGGDRTSEQGTGEISVNRAETGHEKAADRKAAKGVEKKLKQTAPVEAANKSAVLQENNKAEKRFDNGLVVEDAKFGSGVAAAKGKRVFIHYIGKLVNGGKVFDKNTKGKPYAFVVGRGEVIKGLELGIAGMKEGGERRIVIPAALAYGSRGAPPDIPKNAALEFEIKLVQVK